MGLGRWERHSNAALSFHDECNVIKEAARSPEDRQDKLSGS